MADKRDHVLMVLDSRDAMALFWRNGMCGYTHDLHDAHLFTEEEAYSQHRCRPEVDVPIPQSVAWEHAGRSVGYETLLTWRRTAIDPRIKNERIGGARG